MSIFGDKNFWRRIPSSDLESTSKKIVRKLSYLFFISIIFDAVFWKLNFELWARFWYNFWSINSVFGTGKVAHSSWYFRQNAIIAPFSASLPILIVELINQRYFKNYIKIAAPLLWKDFLKINEGRKEGGSKEGAGRCELFPKINKRPWTFILDLKVIDCVRSK